MQVSRMDDVSNICPEVNEVLTNYSYDKFESDVENNNAHVWSVSTDVEKQACCGVDSKYYSDISDTEDIELIDDKKDDVIWVKSIIRLSNKTIINYPTKHKEVQINFIKND